MYGVIVDDRFRLNVRHIALQVASITSGQRDMVLAVDGEKPVIQQVHDLIGIFNTRYKLMQVNPFVHELQQQIGMHIGRSNGLVTGFETLVIPLAPALEDARFLFAPIQTAMVGSACGEAMANIFQAWVDEQFPYPSACRDHVFNGDENGLESRLKKWMDYHKKLFGPGFRV